MPQCAADVFELPTRGPPPTATLALVLHKVTEFLACELAQPSLCAPKWSEFEWRIARAVASIQGISALLRARMRWHGPTSWQRFLDEQCAQSMLRHELITRLIHQIDKQAQALGVSLVALKGAALRNYCIYGPGERPMGDIDLLADGLAMERISEVLNKCGYEPAFVIPRHRVYRPCNSIPIVGIAFGEHIDYPIKIEVHACIAEALPVQVTDITDSLLPRMPQPGLNGYPSLSSLLMHLALHAAGNMRARALRFIQLHDIASLAPLLNAADWHEFLSVRAGKSSLWWALPPLSLTARYYQNAIPSAVLENLSGQCSARLAKRSQHQDLTAVSWSNIRIEAFPGLEWSRSIRESISFMKTRIWPNRAARQELQEGATQMPASDTVPWYRISHPARIVRWIFSNPPRVQTLLSVRAALTQNN